MSKPHHHLAIIFKNGNEEQHEAPVYRDVSVSPETRDLCSELIEKAEALPRSIRHETGDLQKYLECIEELQALMADLKSLESVQREPYRKISQQISTAIDTEWKRLVDCRQTLKEEIKRYRDMVFQGQERQRRDLEEKADEKEVLAKHSSDPEEKRRAVAQAALLRQEAEKSEPPTVPGTALTYYWDHELEDILVLCKSKNRDFIIEDPLDHKKINEAIRYIEESGSKITPHTFPGILLIKKSKLAITAKLKR
jgi:hypothetical protein